MTIFNDMNNIIRCTLVFAAISVFSSYSMREDDNNSMINDKMLPNDMIKRVALNYENFTNIFEEYKNFLKRCPNFIKIKKSSFCCCPEPEYEDPFSYVFVFNNGEFSTCDCIRCDLCIVKGSFQPSGASLENDNAWFNFFKSTFVPNLNKLYENQKIKYNTLFHSV